MYTYLGSVTLRTGEQMELGVVRCPDPSWGAQVKPLLGHKSRETHFHFDSAFDGPLDDLETRFYLGTIGGLAVTNVMIVGARGVGILGHVYTRPEHRQKGAYRHLMAAQMADCQRQGFRALTLGTGFETHPYRIYESFGFRSIDGKSGKMWWFAEPDFQGHWLAPAETTVRPMQWGDWAALTLLGFQPDVPGEPLPRSWTFRIKGQGGGAESAFQAMQRNLSRGARISAFSLRSERGAVAGWAVLQPDDLAFGDGSLLDLYVHPAFQQDAPKLLAAMPWPDHARVAAYTTGPDNYRCAALLEAGFKDTAVLPGWLKSGEQRQDLRVLVRE